MMQVQLKNTTDLLITNGSMACIFISDYLLVVLYFITQITGLWIVQGWCTYSRPFFAKVYACVLEEGFVAGYCTSALLFFFCLLKRLQREPKKTPTYKF